MRNSNTSRIIKEQEANGLLSQLGSANPLSKVPILGDILFQRDKKNKKSLD